MKISEILREAADVHLWHGEGRLWDSCQESYTCCAVCNVDCSAIEQRAVFRFLRRLGLDTESCSQFDDTHFDDSAALQGARFLWLDFAALVAEDEGI